jgi:hypothetical protein
LVMVLEQTEARNDFIGAGQQQFNWPTDCELVAWKPVRLGNQSRSESRVGVWQLEVSPAGSLKLKEVMAGGSGQSMRLA